MPPDDRGAFDPAILFVAHAGPFAPSADALFRNARGTGAATTAFGFDANGTVDTLGYGQFPTRYGKPFAYQAAPSPRRQFRR